MGDAEDIGRRDGFGGESGSDDIADAPADAGRRTAGPIADGRLCVSTLMHTAVSSVNFTTPELSWKTLSVQSTPRR